MKKRFFLTLAGVLLGSSVVLAQDANTVGHEGIMLIQNGKMDEGLALMKQATEMTPKDPLWHMNYGSMLFSKGGSLHRAGNKAAALPVIKEAEWELSETVRLLKQEGGRQVALAQCLFVLGDIHLHIYEDKPKAKQFYEEVLAVYPGHQEAQDALKNLSN